VSLGRAGNPTPTPARAPRSTRERLVDVAPFLVGLVMFALIAVWDQVRSIELWRNYAISGILLGAPSVYVIARADVRVPHYVQWVIVAALLLHYVGGSLAGPDPYTFGPLRMHGVNGAYHTFPWWDHLTHGMGIGAGSLGVAYMLEVYQARRGLRWAWWTVALLALASGLAAGVAVELYEYGGKTLFQTIDQGGYRNTAQDLQFNFLGAGLGAALGVWINRLVYGERLRAQAPASLPSARPGTAPGRPDPLTRSMRAFTLFVGIPAAVSLAMAARAVVSPGDNLDDARYELLLRTLTAAALAGTAAAAGLLAASRRRGAAA